MKRYRRTQLLIEHGRLDAIQISEEISQSYPMTVIVEPHLGLTMIKQRETAKNTLFYSGEILITECKVRHENFIGTGIVKGSDAEFSYALAVIDLAYQSDWVECAELNQLLLELEVKDQELMEEKMKRYNKTRVDFTTMDQ